MKSTKFSILISLVLSIAIVVLVILTIARPSLFQPDIFVQDTPELSLPEGAKARFGKPDIHGTGGRDIHEVAYAPDGNRLAVASSIGVFIYNPQTSEELHSLKGHRAEVYSVAFSPDGNMLASGAEDDTVRLWDAVTGEHKRTLIGHTSTVYGHTGSVYSVAFSPDGMILASGSADQTIRLWDVATGEHKRTLTGHTGQIKSVAFSPDGTTLVSGSADFTIRLWDAVTGDYLKNLTGHGQRPVYRLAFSPDGTALACGTTDGVKLWDAATGQPTAAIAGSQIISIAFSPDSNTLAGGSDDATVRLWDVVTGVQKQTLTGHTSIIHSIAFSPDGSTLASGSTGRNGAPVGLAPIRRVDEEWFKHPRFGTVITQAVLTFTY